MRKPEDAATEAERRINEAAHNQARELSLSYLKQLIAVPDSLGQLTTFTKLDLSDNKLTAVADTTGQLTSLTTLDLSGNQLTEIPDWISRLKRLFHLYLTHEN